MFLLVDLRLALPRGAGVSNNINYLPRGLGKSNCIELQCVSGSTPKPFPLIDSGLQIGSRDDAPGPFPTRAFAETVAGEGRNARTS